MGFSHKSCLDADNQAISDWYSGPWIETPLAPISTFTSDRLDLTDPFAAEIYETRGKLRCNLSNFRGATAQCYIKLAEPPGAPLYPTFLGNLPPVSTPFGTWGEWKGANVAATGGVWTSGYIPISDAVPPDMPENCNGTVIGWIIWESVDSRPFLLVTPAFTNLITGDCGQCPTVELVRFGAIGTNVRYDSSTGKLAPSAGNDFVAKIKASNLDGNFYIEFVQGIRVRQIDHYINGITTTDYLAGASATTYCLDNHDPYLNQTFTESGSGLKTEETHDGPSKTFNIPLAISLGIDQSSVLYEYEMYVGYRFSDSTRKGLGVVQWSWGGTIDINTNGTSSLSSSIDPGTPSGVGTSTMPTYDCTLINTQ